MQSIQVVVEFLQLLVTMGPDDKDSINVRAPHLWFPKGGLQSLHFKAFHEHFGHDWREGNPVAAPSACSHFCLALQDLLLLPPRTYFYVHHMLPCVEN